MNCASDLCTSDLCTVLVISVLCYNMPENTSKWEFNHGEKANIQPNGHHVRMSDIVCSKKEY